MEGKQREKASFGEGTNVVRKASGGTRRVGEIDELVVYNSNSIQKYDCVVPAAACNRETLKAQPLQSFATSAHRNSKLNERNVSFFGN
tara:strand:- start:871 stop:1134 length:264 start_codon:yes stop_codon:yes gene_type:complete